jgi:dehydrogenase/reductase SDR family protein 4
MSTTTIAESAPADRWAPPLTGRVALVTGGSRGIGLAAVHALSAAGAKVAICGRTAETCKEAVAAVEAAGGEALPVVANVGKVDELSGVVAAVMDHWGRLDVLVNNAGANATWGPMADTTQKGFDRVFAVNVFAPMVLVREALAAGMGRGASVINMASAAGLRSEAGMGAYSASKAAIISATRTMARELGPHGIRVNAIAPGVIRTDFSQLLTETPELHARVIATTALGRVGTPDECGGAVVFLASDAASYITGSVLVVDGGTLA